MEEKKPRMKLLKAIINGDILLLLRADKLFPYILYFFILGWISVWISYRSEQTMTQVERNKKELESLKIYHAQKTCEFVGLDRISTIEQLLIENNSEVKAPEKPANILK
jgi:hypothetical protein